MMFPKLLNSRNSSVVRSRGLRVLGSVILLGTAVACGETNDPQPEATRSGTNRNQPGQNDSTTRNTAGDDDAPVANAGNDDDDRDLSIGSGEEVDEDLGINGGRTRAGGGGGRNRNDNDDDETSDGGVDEDVDAGDVDAGDEDAGEDAGVDEVVVVDAGDAGVAP
jgi:hypothetical protein